jgi:hypothetical protein
MRSTVAARPASNVNVVTTNAPVVIGLQTRLTPTTATTRLDDTNVEPPNVGPVPNEQGTRTQEGAHNAPEATETNSLLADIISIIAGPKPSNPSKNEHLPNEENLTNENPQQVQQGTTAPEPSMTAAPGAQPTIQLGQSMTLQGATLTLTPGLSTTVGTGLEATYIEIVSDAAGQTTITLSSSGTAVTATVTNVPTTMTLASNFEASVTSAGMPGEYGSSSASAPALTSSRAEAVHLKHGTSLTLHVLMVFLGTGVAL